MAAPPGQQRRGASNGPGATPSGMPGQASTGPDSAGWGPGPQQQQQQPPVPALIERRQEIGKAEAPLPGGPPPLQVGPSASPGDFDAAAAAAAAAAARSSAGQGPSAGAWEARSQPSYSGLFRNGQQGASRHAGQPDDTWAYVDASGKVQLALGEPGLPPPSAQAQPSGFKDVEDPLGEGQYTAAFENARQARKVGGPDVRVPSLDANAVSNHPTPSTTRAPAAAATATTPQASTPTPPRRRSAARPKCCTLL